jgi:uncharacterized protein YndB with AHSA1/START domain
MPDEVTREILIPAPPEEVWDAVTDPGWFGEGVVELRPGGELRLMLPDGGRREGFVEEAEPAERLVFWWAAPGTESTRVEVSLEAEEAGTRVTVVEGRPLARLEQWVASGPQATALASAR